MIKPFKTIDEQIDLLISRGLIISDRDIAYDFLLRHNYYRISGYTLTLRNHDTFYNNVTIENVIEIYNCDHELRHLLLNHLETIEVTVKSVYSYEFAKLHDALGYLNNAYFSDVEKYNEIISKCETQRNQRRKYEDYIKHFESNNEEIPFWAYVDLMTISDISFLYSISESHLQKSIARAFNLNFQNAGELLGKFMHSMTIIRNLCAHGGRLFNRIFQRKPSLNKKEQNVLIRNKDGIIDNSHLCGFILIMRRLLKKSDFQSLIKELQALFDKYPFVEPRYYGFPPDWNKKFKALI